jgi:AraC-like DNA-binding protein
MQRCAASAAGPDNGENGGADGGLKSGAAATFSEAMGASVLDYGLREKTEGMQRPWHCADGYTLLLTLDGAAWVQENLRRKRLGRSDWTLLQTGLQHSYEAIAQWTYAVVRFRGPLFERLFAALRFFPCDNLYFRQANLDSERQFLQFVRTAAQGELLDEVERNARLLALVASVCRHYVRKRFPENPLEHAQQYMMDHLDQPMSLRGLARIAGMSPSNFSRVFKDRTGVSPIQMVNRLRIEQAQALLREFARDIHIDEVAARSGFEDPYYFSRLFKRRTGLSPAAYRARFRAITPR